MGESKEKVLGENTDQKIWLDGSRKVKGMCDSKLFS